MSEAATFFGIVLCIIALVVILTAVRRNGPSASELRLIAERWNGRVDSAGLFAYDEVIFWIDNAAARLYFTKRGKDRRNTHVSIHFPDPELRLDLYLGGDLRKLLGVEDIELGAARFDEAFVISGNRPDLIREYLTDSAQAAIMAVADVSSQFAPDLHLSISGGVMRVTKHCAETDQGGLLVLLTYFEALYYALATSRSRNIEFVSPKLPPAIQDTQCQVCGEALTGQLVHCATCQTPHHLDCWEYFGSCSVYGCGQKNFVEAKRMRAKGPPPEPTQSTRKRSRRE